jgi:hypothetical protein
MRVLTDLQGKRWLFRGQSRCYGHLVPSIDRDSRRDLSRAQKLALERSSIDIFRSSVRFFAHPGEQGALTDDVVALLVLRHYHVPTRILDWSQSPWVAAYFAAQGDDAEDGELWTFDEPLYEHKGANQWKRWPETTTDGKGDPSRFAARLTAFTMKDPPDWFICIFYPSGFHRQNAQLGAYSMTARFARPHDEHIAELLEAPTQHHRYVIPAKLKPTLREILRKRHGVWRGSLFPDVAGAADFAGEVFRHGG